MKLSGGSDEINVKVLESRRWHAAKPS